MTLSDKVRSVAFTLAVGSAGVVVGSVAYGVVDEPVRMRQRVSAAKEEAYQQHIEIVGEQHVPSASTCCFYCPESRLYPIIPNPVIEEDFNNYLLGLYLSFPSGGM